MEGATLNIGIVTTWFERGAAYVSRQYRDILSAQNNVFIFARGGESYAVNDPIWSKPYVFWGKQYKDSSTRIDLAEFKKWLQKNSIDLVIFNEQQDWEAVVFCKRNRIKTVAYIDYYTKETVKYFDLYDALICNTKRHYSVFRTHPQCFYVPWGTDIELYKPSSKVSNARNEVVFFHSAGMGGMGGRKGTDLLLQAFDQISGEARLVIHSQVPSNRYGESSKIIENDRRVEFIEKTVPAPGLYYLGDVYVYPSRLDGLGLTVAEALASGLPVITTDCAPMNEFVIDGYTGLLVDVEHYLSRSDAYYWAESHCSVESLIEKMQFTVDYNVQLIEMKRNAREYAERSLNWKSNLDALNQIISSINIMVLDEERLNQLVGLSLLFSYKRRINGNRLDKRIYRKIYKYLHGLN